MKPRSRLTVTVLLCASYLAAQLCFPRYAAAHPVSQGTLELVIFKDKVRVRARISVEEVTVSTVLRVDEDELYGHAKLTKAFADHAAYFLERFVISADGRKLVGSLLSITPPEAAKQGIDPLQTQREHVSYEFEFTLPSAAANADAAAIAEAAKPLSELEIYHDVLKDKLYTPGVYWQANYIVLHRLYDQDQYQSALLPNDKSLQLTAKWAAEVQPEVPTVSPAQTQVAVGATARDYCHHGIKHILEGWDHLLFVSALVLAATSMWDLIKVVSIFTVAHSLTLAISVLNLFPVPPPSIVEPIIAGSIVFVAVENIFWPQRSRGWERLAVAFGFGLFHGLGFAGGLRDAMEGMPRMSLGVAIVAFCVGVEIGHQLIVLPLYGILTALRRSRPDQPSRERLQALTLKYGSIVISAGGLFFLVSQFLPE